MECDNIQLYVCSLPSIFQSTHSRGVRRYKSQMPDMPDLFQSTHSRGVRRTSCESVRLVIYFNPRTHVECDCRQLRYQLLIIRFQSTHSRGVRPALFFVGVMISKFQSTHSRGVRLRNLWMTRLARLFQSTHSRGVRRLLYSSRSQSA